MAKLTLTDISAGYSSTTTINANNALIETALENTLSRDGTSPNTMSASLDMNNQRLTNLPNAVNNQEPLTLAQANTLTGLNAALTQSGVGDVLYPETATETALSATISNSHIPSPDPRRYGAAVATVDNSTALQMAINVAATDDLELVLPPGRYRHATTLYLFYDAANNTGFPSGAREDGRLIIKGAGAPYSTDFANTEYTGTILEHTGAATIGLNVADSSNTESRNIVLKDFGVYAATSAFPVQIHYSPGIRVENVFVGNTGTGGCVSIQDCWNSEFIKIKTYGDGTNGSAIKYDPTDAGGGNVLWDSCNASYCAVGFDFGAAYSAGRTAHIKNHVMRCCEAGNNVSRNYRFRHGVAGIRLIECWSEFADPGATAVNVEISNYAGWSGLTSGKDPGSIVFDGGRFSQTGTITSGYNVFEIGDDTAASSADAVGKVVMDNVTIRASTNANGIRRHNDSDNGALILTNINWIGGDNEFLIIDDEAQYGPITARNWDADGIGVGHWVKDTSGTQISHWLYDFNQLIPELTSSATAYDYSNSPYLPVRLTCRCNLSNGVTITPPTTPTPQECTIIKSDGTNPFTFEHNGNEINGTASIDFVHETEHCHIKVTYEGTREFMIQPLVPSSEDVTATRAITAADEPGKVFYLNSATEFVTTLPAPRAGLRYTFIVAAAPSGANYTVVTNSSANIMHTMLLDIVGELVYAASQDVVTFVGGTSLVGDRLEVESDGTSWFCKAFSGADGGITTGQT